MRSTSAGNGPGSTREMLASKAKVRSSCIVSSSAQHPGLWQTSLLLRDGQANCDVLVGAKSRFNSSGGGGVGGRSGSASMARCKQQRSAPSASYCRCKISLLRISLACKTTMSVRPPAANARCGDVLLYGVGIDRARERLPTDSVQYRHSRGERAHRGTYVSSIPSFDLKQLCGGRKTRPHSLVNVPAYSKISATPPQQRRARRRTTAGR